MLKLMQPTSASRTPRLLPYFLAPPSHKIATSYYRSIFHPLLCLNKSPRSKADSSRPDDQRGNGQKDSSKPSAQHTPRPRVLERRKNRSSLATEAHLHELQALTQQLFQSKEEQQQSISRELHDNIAQVLAAATVRISLAKDGKIPAWLRQELLDLRDQLTAALADVRTLARELRPALLDHFGFAAALEKHADAFRERTGLNLDVDLEPVAIDFLATDDLTHLFRLSQEALQNVEEHSRAEHAWIRLARNDGHIVLEIGDNGCSFDGDRVTEAQADGHLGLLGMRERAELLGGRFLLEANPGQGTTIRVHLPPPPPSNTVELSL